MDAAHGLVAGRAGVIVRQPGDDFARGVATTQRDSAQLEMRAFGQRHHDFQPPELTTGNQRREFGARALFQRDPQAAHLQAIRTVDHDQV